MRIGIDLSGTKIEGIALDTRLVRAAHGDSSGVRGAAWLWERQSKRDNIWP
jgi:predicted NBD/HSP70 family sugar kinase